MKIIYTNISTGVNFPKPFGTMKNIVLICECSRELSSFWLQKIRHYKEAMETFLELQNTYLTQFYGITETEKALIFVFEFAAEGPLDQYIKSER